MEVHLVLSLVDDEDEPIELEGSAEAILPKLAETTTGPGEVLER